MTDVTRRFDAAKLTLSEIAPYSVVGTFYDYPETWEALRPLADVATEKGYEYGYSDGYTEGKRSRDAEVADLQQQLDAVIERARYLSDEVYEVEVARDQYREQRDSARDQAWALAEAGEKVLNQIDDVIYSGPRDSRVRAYCELRAALLASTERRPMSDRQ